MNVTGRRSGPKIPTEFGFQGTGSAVGAIIAAAIRAACRGEVHLDPAIAKQLTRSLVAPKPQTVNSLTDREREVLVLVAQGLSNQQIADALVISERTARTHVSNILSKLGVASRTQAALLAIREGIAPAS